MFDKTPQGEWVSLDYKSDGEVGEAFSAPPTVSAEPEENPDEEANAAEAEERRYMLMKTTLTALKTVPNLN